MSKLSKTEIVTLRTILRHGGKVFLTDGKKRTKNSVHRKTVEKLEERGIVALWSGHSLVPVYWNAKRKVYCRAPSGFSPVVFADVAVTAEGCRALAGIE